MKDVEILDAFTEEDVKFNRKMIDRALVQNKHPHKYRNKTLTNRHRSNAFPKRNCDYTSDVLSEFRKKWGIYK